MKLNPTVSEVYQVLRNLKPTIADDYRASDDPSDNQPGMQVTFGSDGLGDWDYQTGDNSYTGNAYGFQFWGVTSLYRNSNCRALARDVVNELAEQIASQNETFNFVKKLDRTFEELK